MTHPAPLQDIASVSLVQALFGRRSRRFALGATVPAGPFAYRSRYEPLPLDERERDLVLAATAGVNGPHHLLPSLDGSTALPGYPVSSAGRAFPSPAGYHNSTLFFTDDTGIYVVDPPTDPGPDLGDLSDGVAVLERVAADVRARIRRLEPHRLVLPLRPPFVEPHNTWVANAPGSLLAIPVADVAAQLLSEIWSIGVDGACVYDDLHDRPIPGLEAFADVLDPAEAYPLSAVERSVLGDTDVELATAAYAGALMQQALGLGGWMYNGIEPLAILGVTGDPEAPGLGFGAVHDPRWPDPNPTGRADALACLAPPHVADMHEATARLVARKYGPGGPFDPATPGPWHDSAGARGAVPPAPRLQAAVAHQAQYVLDTFGRFPATVPTAHARMYLQTHHADPEYYDAFYRAPGLLPAHRGHHAAWGEHPVPRGS